MDMDMDMAYGYGYGYGYGSDSRQSTDLVPLKPQLADLRERLANLADRT